MGKACRSSPICLFLIVSLVYALGENNVTTTETSSSKSTTDPTSEIMVEPMSELTAGLTTDTTSAAASIAGSTAPQTEFTTLKETTVMATTQQSGQPSFKINRKFRVALIINPLPKNFKRAGRVTLKKKKKAERLLYQEIAADGKVTESFEMKNLDEVANFLKAYQNVEICNVVCEELDD